MHCLQDTYYLSNSKSGIRQLSQDTYWCFIWRMIKDLLLVWYVLNYLDEGRILFCFALFNVLRLNNSRQTIINIQWLLLEHMYFTNATRHNCCIFYTIGKTMLECVQMWKKKLDWKRFSFYKKKRKLTLTYYNVFSGRWIKNINI